MSEVLIKNMEMPINCGCCEINDDGWCQLVEDHVGWYVHDERCPLVEVPTHGDLIERDELPLNHITDYNLEGHSVVDIEDVLNAPAIIEASKEREL